MKGLHFFRQSYVRIPLLFLLVISPIAMVASSGVSASTVADSSAATCTNAVLAAKMLDTNIPFTQESAISLTEASTAYLNVVSGYSVSLFGIGNIWKYDSTSCTVSWQNFSMNYLLRAANGSQYILTLGANPGTSSVFGVTLNPLLYASLPISNLSASYSGYAIAKNSGYSSEVNYTTAVWYVPTISDANTQNCGSYDDASPPSCQLDVWTGLQNSTYDGVCNTSETTCVYPKGEVIQTGTEGNCFSACTGSDISYQGWTEYVNGNKNGVVQTAGGYCNSGSFSVGSGTEINAIVGSQEVINGTTGNKFYTILYNYTGEACEFMYLNGSTSCSNGVACKIAGKEYFADYFAETPQNGNGVPMMLPTFTSFDFYDMGMISTTQGSYPYYNNGYYLTSYMDNCASGGSPCKQNTSVSTVSENSGSTYAYFSETYDSSEYTG